MGQQDCFLILDGEAAIATLVSPQSTLISQGKLGLGAPNAFLHVGIVGDLPKWLVWRSVTALAQPHCQERNHTLAVLKEMNEIA